MKIINSLNLKKPNFLTRKKSAEIDMTEGSILRHLINFAIPLFFGNILQQLYNLVDTWVVGNFVSNEAFSAVGSTGPIINLLLGTFMGLSNGAGVVISQYYGAKRHDKLQQTVHTSLVMTLSMSVAFTIIGIVATPHILRFMKTPDSVFPDAAAYLTIYFAGLVGSMLYNMGFGILQSVGDTKRPLYYLTICAILNTVLDLIFVLMFDMGVQGVALATVIAQSVSASLVMITLMRAHSGIRVRIRCLKIHWDILGKIIKLGIPAAITTAVSSFANVFGQSYINYFGADFMSGWTAYSKISNLLLMPIQVISLASTVFIGQNLGRNLVERTQKGIRTALGLSMVCTLICLLPLLIFTPGFVSFFNDKVEVINYGTMLLRWITPFYLLRCVNQIYTGALRGSGNGHAPMFIQLFSLVAFKQLYLYLMANFISNTMIGIAMAYPASWILAGVLNLIYFKKNKLNKNKLVEDET